MRGDGNCFYRLVVSHIITGDQEEHASVRVSTMHYMRQNPEVFTGVLNDSETMEQYPHQSNMETPHTWATEVEVFVTAKLLNTPVWVFALCGDDLRWQKFERQLGVCSHP